MCLITSNESCWIAAQPCCTHQPNRPVLLRAVVDGTTCSSRCAHASSKTWMRKGRRFFVGSLSTRSAIGIVLRRPRAAHVSGLVSRERRLRAHAEFARDDRASRRFVEDRRAKLRLWLHASWGRAPLRQWHCASAARRFLSRKCLVVDLVAPWSSTPRRHDGLRSPTTRWSTPMRPDDFESRALGAVHVAKASAVKKPWGTKEVSAPRPCTPEAVRRGALAPFVIRESLAKTPTTRRQRGVCTQTTYETLNGRLLDST